MKRIQQDIAEGQFRTCYLLYGEETYLRQQYEKRLIEALLPQEDTMNTAFYEGSSVDVAEIIDLAGTLPFFADRRVIVLRDTGFFKHKCEDLTKLLDGGLADWLCMIFVEDDVDKRSRMYKAVSKIGRAVEFKRQDAGTLTRWVLQRMDQEGKKITRRDMDLFLSMTGDDMSNIDCELTKLLSYTMDRDVITRKEIEAVCCPQMQSRIFEMVRAVADRKQKKALQLYDDLLALKEPPMRILYLLARQFHQLMQVQEMAAQGFDRAEIGRRMRLQPFVVRNMISCAGKYRPGELQKAVETCIETEEEVKTGRLGDVLGVELLIVSFTEERRGQKCHTRTGST